MDSDMDDDLGRNLVLDGNAVAGELMAVFGVEMTASPATCGHCGSETEMGGTIAYSGGPGIVLRCPTCHEIMLRMVRTPRGSYVDARGIAVVRFSPRP